MKKLNEAKYTRRFNIGDYEHEEYTLSCAVDEDEKGSDVLAELKKEVLEAHTGEPTTTNVTNVLNVSNKEETGKNGKTNSTKKDSKNGKGAGKKNKGSDDEGAENDEGSESKVSDDSNDQSEGSEAGGESEGGEEEGNDGAEGEEGKNTKGKDGKGGKESKKTFKRKPQDYDRSIEQHKEIYSGLLRAVAPDWKKSEESKKKAKKVSEVLEGEPFLDENGEVLEEFKTLLKKKMK